MSHSSFIEPGHWVRHPAQPEWGAGQVQSVIGPRITVNFEHAGKVTLNAAIVALDVLDAPPDPEWQDAGQGRVSG